MTEDHRTAARAADHKRRLEKNPNYQVIGKWRGTEEAEIRARLRSE